MEQEYQNKGGKSGGFDDFDVYVKPTSRLWTSLFCV